MKAITIIVFLFLLYSCTRKEESKLLIPKDNFSVSQLNRKLDSINKSYIEKDSSDIIRLDRYDKRLNKNYLHGAIHFVIMDKNISFYVLDTLRPATLMCGNIADFSQQDSLNFITKNNKFTDLLKPIKTSEIIKILKQNQNFILNKEDNNPLLVSFALKNDTLKGSTIYNIVRFMENKGMQFYTFRRMNEYEIEKTK